MVCEIHEFFAAFEPEFSELLLLAESEYKSSLVQSFDLLSCYQV